MGMPQTIRQYVVTIGAFTLNIDELLFGSQNIYPQGLSDAFTLLGMCRPIKVTAKIPPTHMN